MGVIPDLRGQLVPANITLELLLILGAVQDKPIRPGITHPVAKDKIQPPGNFIDEVQAGEKTRELLFFTASRAHHAEIGGIVPGSMPPFSKTLAEEGVERARELGYPLLRLDTLPAMEAAQALYRSLGFVAAERYSDNPVPGVLFFELRI